MQLTRQSCIGDRNRANIHDRHGAKSHLLLKVLSTKEILG